VKKPSVLGEVFFKPLWESAFLADFHQRRQFPQALVFPFFFAPFFFLGVFHKKILCQDRLGTTIAPSVDL
jgi:hypothetical protein